MIPIVILRKCLWCYNEYIIKFDIKRFVNTFMCIRVVITTTSILSMQRRWRIYTTRITVIFCCCKARNYEPRRGSLNLFSYLQWYTSFKIIQVTELEIVKPYWCSHFHYSYQAVVTGEWAPSSTFCDIASTMWKQKIVAWRLNSKILISWQLTRRKFESLTLMKINKLLCKKN